MASDESCVQLAGGPVAHKATGMEQRFQQPDDAVIEELFLAAYARMPEEGERRAASAYLRSTERSRAQGAEDLLWSLMNTAEFLYNH